MTDGEHVVGVTSRAGSSALWCNDGSGWAWGSDTTGQLGVGLGDGAVVEKPTRLVSKQLAELNVIQVRVRALYLFCVQIAQADQHTMILAEEK
jgi:alpha-tubulin suppressor-like RCC1 family protein